MPPKHRYDLRWVVPVWQAGSLTPEEEAAFADQVTRMIWAQLGKQQVWGMPPEDVVQSVWEKVLRKLGGWKLERGDVSTFLQRVIMSAIGDVKHRAARERSFDAIAFEAGTMFEEFQEQVAAEEGRER